MADLISRSAAMNALSDVFGIPLDYDGECNEMCDEVFAAIEALPAVDAVPVVRCGDCRWYDSAFYACSKCGVCVNRDFYCADGARMDGESEEET